MDEGELTDEQCERALNDFAQITATDEACAHFFLQDVGWNLQVIYKLIIFADKWGIS